GADADRNGRLHRVRRDAHPQASAPGRDRLRGRARCRARADRPEGLHPHPRALQDHRARARPGQGGARDRALGHQVLFGLHHDRQDRPDHPRFRAHRGIVSEHADTAARFDELTRRYYRSWFRFHPEAAVEVGEPGYEDRLTPWDEQARGALVCLNDELRIALEELDAAALDPDRRLDYALLHGAVGLENQYLIDLEPRRPDPRRWLPVNA